MISATSTTTSAASNLLSSTDTSKAKTDSGTDAAAQQDRFLKLLVAQLTNQDPMNPMDNAQMTTQMAQISTVTGIQQLDATVKSLSAQFAAMQMMQGANLVGHDVLIDGNGVALADGHGKSAFDLAGNADNVKVEIVSAGGQVIDTLQLGARSAGRQDFDWDASQYTGSGALTFKVTATAGGAAVSSTPFTRARVESVGSSNGATTLQLQGRPNSVAYADVRAIL